MNNITLTLNLQEDSIFLSQSVLEALDWPKQVQLLIDSDLLKAPYVTMHAVNNTLTMRIRTEDFMDKVLPGLHHEPIVIEIEGEA